MLSFGLESAIRFSAKEIDPQEKDEQRDIVTSARTATTVTLRNGDRQRGRQVSSGSRELDSQIHRLKDRSNVQRIAKFDWKPQQKSQCGLYSTPYLTKKVQLTTVHFLDNRYDAGRAKKMGRP